MMPAFKTPACIDRYFKLTARGTTVATEVRAGLASFLTMCYILAVNARILSESGGPCISDYAVDGNCFASLDCLACVEDFRRQLITVTAISAALGCFFIGMGANLPFAMAPGMGVNAYFTYNVVGFHGSGDIEWKTAITAIFIEGLIFVAISVAGLRTKVAKLIPEPVKIAASGGIGLFLAHLGLQTAEGIGLVVTDMATGLTLGGCPPDKRTYATYGGKTGDAYTCDDLGGQMTSATTWVGIVTLLVISVLLKRRVRGALIIGIGFATVICWFKGTKVSYFEDDVLGGGEDRWEYFKQIVKVEGMSLTAFQLDFSQLWTGELWLALLTFLYVDLLDTTGTFCAVADFAGFMDENGDFEGQQAGFVADGLATTVGALLGTSPVTTYIESASGIEEGGRTGLTAIVVGVLFACSIFFAPLLASVPPWASGPALIIVGAMMMKGLVKVDWKDYNAAIPAFLTIAVMPLTYSIAYGLIAGISSWVILWASDVSLNFLTVRLWGKSNGEAKEAAEVHESEKGKIEAESQPSVQAKEAAEQHESNTGELEAEHQPSEQFV